jgi:prolipoprotein diacylglyceryl transferase
MTTTLLAYFPSPPRGVWYLGPVPIRAYALCIIVGIVVALLIGDRRWQARGGERGVIYDIALWAVPFGLVGGRLYHLITDWRTYFGDTGVGLGATLRIWDGGLGIWGAVAFGGVGAWIGCRRRGIPLPAFGDAIAPGIVLAQAIGRLGNYFNQELYGRETTLPWGMEIFWRHGPGGMRDPHLLDGVSSGELYKVVQPTFLYELLWNVGVFVLLIYLDRRFRTGHGRLFGLYVAGYCVGRFCIELLRDDAATHIAGIRINSFTSTFVFIGAVVYIILAPKGREDPEALRRIGQEEQADVQASAPEPEKELVAVGVAVGAAEPDASSADHDVAEPQSGQDEAVPEDEAPDAKLADVDQPEPADADAPEPENAQAESEPEPETVAAEVPEQVAETTEADEAAADEPETEQPTPGEPPDEAPGMDSGDDQPRGEVLEVGDDGWPATEATETTTGESEAEPAGNEGAAIEEAPVIADQPEEAPFDTADAGADGDVGNEQPPRWRVRSFLIEEEPLREAERVDETAKRRQRLWRRRGT